MIEVRGLRKSFGSREIFCGLDFSVPRGGVTALLGPSGDGKSTLLRTLIGLEGFQAGEVQVDTEVLRAGSYPGRERTCQAIRRRVGMVFQQYQLFPHRTAVENVMEGPIHVLGQAPEKARRRAMELIDRLDLRGCADLRPRSLSGGQQQRVAIARALAMVPDVILWDEPTSALDPRMTAEVAELIRDLAEGGQTMLIVTHAIPFAEEIATRIVQLRQGIIVPV